MSPEDSSRLELRKKYIRARKNLSPAERAEKSRMAAERIDALPEFSAARTVMLYRAVRGELSLDLLPDLPSSAGKRFVYPRCVSETEIAALLPGGWMSGAFGIPEPAVETSERIRPEEIDLVVCPGVSFDSRGTRLGMGGGYYDRFLPRCPRAVRVMAAFELQHALALPRSALDIPMDIIVTESAVRRFGERNRTCD